MLLNNELSKYPVRALFLALFLIILPFKSIAHPHVFITKQAILYFDKTGLTGIRNIWEFDEIFSSTVIDEYDRNHNGLFEGAEKKDIYNSAFINIRDFNYYTYVIHNKESIRHEKDINFIPRIEDDCLIYEFTIPLNIKAGKKETSVEIFVGDGTYYIDFNKFIEEDIAIKAPKNLAVRYTFAECNLENSYGGEFTNLLELYFKQR